MYKYYLILATVTILNSCNNSENSSNDDDYTGYSVTDMKYSAKQYLNNSRLIHGVDELDYYESLSDPSICMYTFYGAVCYGRTSMDCSYENIYVVTKNYGKSWVVDF